MTGEDSGEKLPPSPLAMHLGIMQVNPGRLLKRRPLLK